MIRPVAVSQTKKCFLHRWPGGEKRGKFRIGVRLGCMRRGGHAVAARSFGATAVYFLRSLRFQQAVSGAAFSLVIGIRVLYIDPFTEPGFTPEEINHLIIPAMSAACVGTS